MSKWAHTSMHHGTSVASVALHVSTYSTSLGKKAEWPFDHPLTHPRLILQRPARPLPREADLQPLEYS
jgi:hypothetical protein